MTPAQVEKFLQTLNESWLSQDYTALATLYDPDVILLPPDAGEPIEGRSAVCSAYEDFHAACTVERFAVTALSSWAFGSTNQSVTKAHMRFDIDYKLHGAETAAGKPLAPESFCEQGLEVYTLVNAAHENPRIIWRAQFTL